MSADSIMSEMPHDDEGSGAVCLLVLAFGIIVFAVACSVMACSPQGSSLGAADRTAARTAAASIGR